MSCSYCYRKIEGENEWRHKLCDCKGNSELCCKTWFCPCVVFGQTARHVDESCCACACFWLLGFAGCWAAMRIRGLIRQKYSINGSWQNDCAMAYCCGMCALLQYAQEVEDRKSDAENDDSKAQDIGTAETSLQEVEDDPFY